MGTVTLRNLKKSFGVVEVIKGVNIDIDDGEFVILVGPSGCGKSTLLRMVAGLEDVTGGDVAIDGQVITNVAPKDRDIAMVFQNYALYPHFTVEKNMGFSLKLAGVPKDQITKQVAAVAQSLGLTDYLQRYPKELSGGQRQRVATGRAIVRNPKVFLFDEPLSNLDAKLRVQMRSEIRSLQQRLGVTSIYVTHDQVEAMTMADKIVVLRGGVVEQIGSPLDLYDRPANTFVASFIGSPAMNLITGTATSDTARLFADFAIPVQGKIENGSDITVGFRPDHITVVEPGTSSAFPTKVASYEATGSETMLFVTKADQPLTVVTKDRLHLTAGDTVWLKPDMSKAHYFGGDGIRVAGE
ncbi:sn-glycerol-3-phosphate ABC transporter ATP-binding protein UgpC [Devosia algicola]|uniref:Sn-glycerol-3-phosphate ABC transporter ATP-binding protein UgpC n=1 Tax=Devosia algicola TaxID=3026418 RepID=A0ABY7YJH0_9HYPH|nr:sn-glycerol-3-phosphate ABC transporter ATP-binding protein UgpC [Devosia algicola]WDR01337.1 sn-glycerol-3-phosphate ABC transporter ATP-binding protein UgpC [Devosia algicola]